MIGRDTFGGDDEDESESEGDEEEESEDAPLDLGESGFRSPGLIEWDRFFQGLRGSGNGQKKPVVIDARNQTDPSAAFTAAYHSLRKRYSLPADGVFVVSPETEGALRERMAVTFEVRIRSLTAGEDVVTIPGFPDGVAAYFDPSTVFCSGEPAYPDRVAVVEYLPPVDEAGDESEREIWER